MSSTSTSLRLMSTGWPLTRSLFETLTNGVRKRSESSRRSRHSLIQLRANPLQVQWHEGVPQLSRVVDRDAGISALLATASLT